MNELFTVNRRTLLKSGGALTLTFAFPFPAFSQSGNVNIPKNLKRNPNLASWLRVKSDGKITLLIGKVELGQGTVTAAAQVAADELKIDFSRLNVISGDTVQGPNERTTAGSGSAPGCFPAVHQAAAEVRNILLKMASEKLGESLDNLKIIDGTISGKNGSVTYWELVDGLDLNVEPTGLAKLIPISEHKYIGQSVPRIDIPGKMTGSESFVQEMNPSGVVFGAIARPPTYEASLVNVDISKIEAMPGVLKVARNGSLLGVVAEHQDQAWFAAAELSKSASWDVKSVLPTSDGIFDWLETAESEEKELVNTGNGGGTVNKVFERSYHRPYQMHGSIGTSAALAVLDNNGIMTVHTHSQAVFAAADAIAEFLGMDPKKVHCIHTHGSGCYGHNMADDAAADAAWLASQYPGKPVKLQYTREEEHQWEPYGSAMTMKARAGVDAAGDIVNWNMEIWSTPHSTRPSGSATRLLSGRYVDPPFVMAKRKDCGGPNYCSARNGIPDYEFPNTRVSSHFVTDMPIRVSAFRGLGAYANGFAIESFIDEIARDSGSDPVEYRLKYLKDPRARDVLVKTAEIFGWDEWKPEKNKGRGIAFSRYKNSQAYCAVAIEIRVVPRNGRIRLIRAASACDCGHMVAPDNIVNQIEGGIIQSLSATLKEEVKFDNTSVLSRDWASYPILTFSEVPPIEVALINRPGEKYLGTAEASQAQAGPAVANALFDAVGARVTRIPLTPDRVKEAISSI